MKICLNCEGISTQEHERCDHCDAVLLPVDAVHYPVRRGEADAGNPLLGAVVDGKYRLRSVLGRGGMGTVFAAMHDVSLVPVAVKLLHPRLSARSEFKNALLAEARKAGRVVHDHCARVLDVGETVDGTVYLALELAEGETLDAWTRAGGLAPPIAVEVLVQVCRALVAIHAAGLVHRDLSSRNVMVAVRDGRPWVKVLDFGIAAGASLAGRGSGDRGREPAGFANPVFSAPELLAGQDCDARADLYSLGVLAVLALTGQLPVQAHDPRQAARATIAGELEPLPPLPGVPRRLQRLLRRCLERDPARRPLTATAVLNELENLRAQRRPWLSRLSVSALVGSCMLALLAFVEPGRPFLQMPGGSRLQLTDQALPANASVQHLRPAELATVRCWFGGFRPEQLQLVIGRDGASLARMPLLPEIDRAGGQLTLRSEQPAWGKALDTIAKTSLGGPVELSWSVPGRAPMAMARVQVDGEPPQVDGRIVGVDGSAGLVLRQDTVLRCAFTDAVGIAAAGVEVTLGGDRVVALPVGGRGGEFALGRALHGELPGTNDQGGGELVLWAEDPAGNRARQTWSFTRCDLAVPGVAEVTGPAGEPVVPYLEGRASLAVRFDQDENEVALELYDDRGTALGAVRGLAGAGPHVLPVVAPAGAQPAFANGADYWFLVRDAVGNERRCGWRAAFKNRQIDPAMRVRTGDGMPLAALVGPTELVATTAGVRLEFRCSEVFTAVGVELRDGDGVPARDADSARLLAAAAGSAEIVLGALQPGEHRLVVRLEETGERAGRGGTTLAWSLRVLPDHLAVRVPRSDCRFLPGLIDAGVLAMVDGRLREGAGWRVDGAWQRQLEGALWTQAGSWTSLPLPDRRQPEAPLLPWVAPTAGHNVLALELRDVLGRPARVLVADQEAPVVRHEGRELAVIAAFWHHDGAPELIGEELLVEYEQPLTVQVRVPLRFLPAERPLLRLGVGATEVVAKDLADDEAQGSIVTFEVPAKTWSTASGLDAVARTDYGLNRQVRVDCHLVTPARAERQPIRLALKTTRSILRPVQVGELVGASVAAPLAALQFLPVLAPDGPLPDPLPADAPGRQVFAIGVANSIRNVGDLLLQDREVTLAAYAALLTTVMGRAGEPWSPTLVHADDPLGPRRLLPANLLPLPYGERVDEFLAAAAKVPDRPVTGVTFFQAHAFCRLLGMVLAADEDLFRLPFGCELDLAAFGGRTGTARHGAALHGGVDAAAFLAAALGDGAPDALASITAGDQVPAAAAGHWFAGLDFGVREWVADLPFERGNELLRDWRSDHGSHQTHVHEFATGRARPPASLAARLQAFGIVRGLAFGELAGVIDEAGRPLPLAGMTRLPASVPGVLRAEQLRRDGRDLLPERIDPRLLHVGFRLAAHRELQRRLRGKP